MVERWWMGGRRGMPCGDWAEGELSSASACLPPLLSSFPPRYFPPMLHISIARQLANFVAGTLRILQATVLECRNNSTCYSTILSPYSWNMPVAKLAVL
jgi:hypothetical protein